jgi:hypothetical protein
MKWELLLNEKENILFAKTFGIFDLATKIDLMKECLVKIEKKNYHRHLIDNREIETIKISVLEIYSLPERFTELNVPRNLHIAEVFSEKHKEDFSFLETVCRNNGYWLSVFSDIESALQWLKQ